MSITILTWLVKISVIENLTPVSFYAEHCVLFHSIYCSKRYAYSIIEQQGKRTFHRNQGNQAFVGWGDLYTALSLTYLLQVACLHHGTYLL